MRLGDHDSFVDIEVLETVAANMPRAGDIHLKVTVHGAGFRGVHDDVWVRHSSAQRFIEDLYEMARGDREDAALSAVANRELALRFSRPMRTHVLVEGKLKRVGPGSPATISAWVAFAVYVHRSSLKTLADTLSESWLAPAQSAGAH